MTYHVFVLSYWYELANKMYIFIWVDCLANVWWTVVCTDADPQKKREASPLFLRGSRTGAPINVFWSNNIWYEPGLGKRVPLNLLPSYNVKIHVFLRILFILNAYFLQSKIMFVLSFWLYFVLPIVIWCVCTG